MKVLHIINYFQPQLGYQEYYLAKESLRSGDLPIILTSDRYFPFPNYDFTVKKILGDRINKVGYFKENGIITIRLKPFFEINSHLVLANLTSHIKKIAPDIVILHGFYTTHFPIIAKLKKKSDFFLILDMHMNPNQDLPLFFRLYKLFYDKIILTKFYNQIDAVFTITKHLQSYINELHPQLNKITHFIPLGVDIDLYKPDLSVRKKKALEYQIDLENDIVLFYSGKIIPKKGLFDIIKIGTNLKKKKKNGSIILFFVGNGNQDLIKKLKMKANQSKIRIIFHDFVTQKELAMLFNIANYAFWIGEIPSASKYEAIASGIPIVISNKFKENFVAEKTFGMIFNGENHYEISEWIIKNSKTFKDWKDLSKKVRYETEKNYSWKIVYGKIKSLKKNRFIK